MATKQAPIKTSERRNGASAPRSKSVPRGLLAAGLGASMLAFVAARQLAHVIRSVRVSYAPSRRDSAQPNDDQLMGKWHEIKGRIKQKWGDLTDDEIAQAEGKLEELAGKIQQKYGGTKANIRAQLRKL